MYNDVMKTERNQYPKPAIYLAPAEENSKERKRVRSGRVILIRKGCHVLVTDLVPSEMACLASSPGRISRTDV